jgi:hypothetical protein
MFEEVGRNIQIHIPFNMLDLINKSVNSKGV